MKQLIFIFTALLLCDNAMADDEYPYLTFEDSDGSTISISVKSLEITVSNGELIVINSEKSTTLTLLSLSKMYFTTTDITDTSSVDEVIPIKGERAEVLTLSGISMGIFPNVNTARKALPKGIYLIKSNYGTHKMSIR